MNKLLSKDLNYQHFLLIKKLLSLEKKMELMVSGTSMMPLYEPTGEVALVEGINCLEELKRFDVIVFWQNNGLIIHYFWGVCPNFNEDPSNPLIVTRPLNPVRGFDHPIYFDRILGVVSKKKIGFWLKIKIYLNMLFS